MIGLEMVGLKMIERITSLFGAASWRPRLWLALVLAASTASAAGVPDAVDMAPSDDGAYVLDARAQVAWSRCVEGMHWTGKTCAGTPLLFSHAEAMALALERERTTGLHWRVPRVVELQRLVNKDTSPRGVDPKLFPATPRNWHWTSTAAINTARVNQYDYGNIMQGRNEQNANHMAYLHGWAVNLASGESRGDVTKRTKLPVRLVLSLD
jgi:hypothetical protein